MRRLPVYLVVDMSESMAGEPIKLVENGINAMLTELRSDPYALETCFLSIIGFAGNAVQLVPLTEVYRFIVPKLGIGSGTSLGSAMDCLMNSINKDVVRTTSEAKGDYKPLAFLFTDGKPTDADNSYIAKWLSFRKRCNLVAVSIGDNADTKILKKLTEMIYRLNKLDSASFRQFFKWVSASVSISSVAVDNTGNSDISMPEVDGKVISEVKTEECSEGTDDVGASFLSKCVRKNKTFILKYLPRDGENPQNLHFVRHYMIDEDLYNSLTGNEAGYKVVDSNNIYGQPICPVCKNRFSITSCPWCNKFSCADGSDSVCPWCGNECGEIIDERFDMNSGKG